MKTRIQKSIIALACILVVNSQLATLRAQGTTFTYQGRLLDGGQPANGTNYGMVLYLYDAVSGGALLGNEGIVSVTVSNGLFTVPLNFDNVFNGGPRWLEITVQKNGGGFTTLSPRQQLTPAPYAIFAENVGSGGISAGTYTNAVTFNNAGNIFNGSFNGNGVGISNVNASTLGGLSSSNFWKLGGNTGANPANGNFIGTTDNLPLELKVNGIRALRIEPTVNDVIHSNIVNVIGGSPVNFVSNSVVGATIAGGGAVNYLFNHYTNSVAGDFGTVGGGAQNTASGAGATVGGGYFNLANGYYATVGGGFNNKISDNYATVGGGNNNTASGRYSTVSGGDGNIASGFEATVGGGIGNSSGGRYATVGGGSSNSATNDYATVSGGYVNIAGNTYATVVGGYGNIASGSAAMVGGYGNTASGDNATVGGGVANRASTNFATVSGGEYNVARGSDAAIGGGESNTGGGDYATVGGGLGNSANGAYATVGGGRNNIASGPAHSTVAGGDGNTASTSWATVGGGGGNTASGYAATVPGGANCVAAGDYSFAAGNTAKANHQGTFVWADSQAGNFASTSSDQFLIRAQNGVGIGNNNPQAPLHITGGGDAGMNAGGNIISGQTSGQNLVIDNNEIISRNNGLASDLILNFGSGNVGIGRNPTTNRLEVGGDASKATAGSWLANSDARIKTDVETITNALDKLSAVRLVQFRYTDDYRATHPGVQDRKYLNVVAQEFQKVFPEEVKRSGEKLANGEDILQVDTYPLTIYSAAAIQELNQKLELQAREKDAHISTLEKELWELKQTVKRLSDRRD